MAEKNLGISRLLDCYGGMLTEKQRLLLEYYYEQDLSLSEISDNEGITRQGVRDIIKRAEKQIYECESRIGMCALTEKYSGALEKIVETARSAVNGESDKRAALQTILEISETI